MSASSALLSERSSPPGGLPGGARHDDGVVQLEADRQLLQRLEHQRVEVPDRSEVEEPQHAVGDR